MIGPSYQSQSPNADCERCINFYIEALESGQGKNTFAMYRAPGLKKFATLPGMQNVRQQFFFTGAGAPNGRFFAIGENQFNQALFELLSDGSVITQTTLGGPGAYASMTANNANQLLIASGGRVFLFALDTNTTIEINTTDGSQLQGPISLVDFSDGFFFALLANSQKFQISKILDGSSWDPLDIAEVSEYTDNVVTMVVDHREGVFGGAKATVAYQNTGDIFPFNPDPSGFVEHGMATIAPPVKLDNSIFWLEGGTEGGGIARRANGFTPVRVSNHAVESIWQNYPTISDAEYYAFQYQGHSFWHIYFPSANASWRYDVSTGLWCEVSSLDVHGQPGAHKSRCHAFAFNKHLVGDWSSANIYEMAQVYYDDDGQAQICTRITPFVTTELQRIFHSQMILDIETGVGPQPPLLDGSGAPRGPQVMLQWSDTFAKTWSNEHWESFGQAGDYFKRVYWNRLGYSRQRVYKFVISDPVPARIVDAYLEASPGFKVPSERISKQLTKVQ